MIQKTPLKCPNKECKSHSERNGQLMLDWKPIGGPASTNTLFVVWYCVDCRTAISITTSIQN